MYVQPFDGAVAPNSLASPGGTIDGEVPFLTGGAATTAPPDNISRFMPPWSGNDGAAATPMAFEGLFGPLLGMMQQLMQMLQSLAGCGQRFFPNAAGSSAGDPHLCLNGSRWNEMGSEPDLLNSNSIAGGFRVSTQATPPNGKGAAWNQSATVSLNGGATTVTLSNDGAPSIESYGQKLPLVAGQTLQLGGGASASLNRNGALRVVAQNGDGGRILTTLSAQGEGVNVDVSAHNVDLGGALTHNDEGRRYE